MPVDYEVKNTARAREVIKVLVKHGFGRILDRLNLEQVPGIGRVIIRVTRRRAPGLTPIDRLRIVLEELGPTFIKFGQLMASRPDLVSPEVAGALSDLNDRVPPFPGEEAMSIIDTALPGVRDSFFRSISLESQAAASIAQVHFGVLKDGTPVAVKVRRPGIRKMVETDINILFILARLVEKYISEAGVYEPVKIVREFARSIRREMDFTLEASNVERFASNFKEDPRAVMPRIFWEATSPEVLTVERISGGIPVDDREAMVEAGLDPKVVARNLVELFLKQVLEHGFFHADPHGGNLVALEGERIGFMDFGIVGQLDLELRRSLGNIFMALVEFDSEKLVREYMKMEVLGEDVDMTAFKNDLKDFIKAYYGLPLERLPLGEIMFNSMQITLRHRIRVPPDIILLAKTWLTLEGVVRKLDPEMNLLELARRYATGMTAGMLSPAEIVNRLRGMLEDYSQLAGAFPRQVSQLLGKIIRGKLRIDFYHANLENLIREMDRSANRLSFSLVISAIIIGSTLIIITDKGYKLFGYPVLGMAGFCFAGILGIWLVLAILRSGRL